MEQLRQPAVFLVPTIQLVEQVASEGRKIGIPVVHWARGESHAPADALECKAIIVCTYEKFFNGRSTFGRANASVVPGAVVLDDVHAGIESVRKMFGAVLSGEARREVIGILEQDLAAFDPVALAGIRRGEPSAVLEVPHWLFSAHITKIREALGSAARGEGDIFFSWPNLSQMLAHCRLVLSGVSAQIALDPPAVQQLVHYRNSAHRLFMSASVHDGAVLVRELDCEESAAANVVSPEDDSGVGERMVIVPSLVNLEFSTADLIAVAKRVSVEANVVVLVPSEAAASPWVAAGAKYADTRGVSDLIAQLRSSSAGTIAVFAQRYDGVDLPDAACRLLIIDGLPAGESLVDRADQMALGGVVGVRAKVANRIEQGLGRAVRSASDYCAVLLAGRDLANFISRAAVLSNFSPATVRQLEIGKRISKELAAAEDRVSATVDAVLQCLRRDLGWKQFYSKSMSGSFDGVATVLQAAESKLRIAALERRASGSAFSNDPYSAFAFLQTAADCCGDDVVSRGALKQAAARYIFAVDRVRAMEMQSSAFADNPGLSRPPVIAPRLVRRVTSQAEGVVQWLRSFQDLNGALLEIDDLRARLSFSGSASSVESAMCALGSIIGAESSQPEKEFGRGPDVLWLFDDVALVIEVKSEKVSPLSKGDAGQLQQSLLWVRENIRGVGDPFPVLVSNVVVADEVGDFAFGARCWNEQDILGIASNFRALIASGILEGPSFASSPTKVQAKLAPHNLVAGQLRASLRRVISK